MKAKAQRTLLTLLRQQFETWPEDAVSADKWIDPEMANQLRQRVDRISPLIGRVRAFGELFVGMANGPFLLIMKADEPARFLEFADENPTHEVFITFESAASQPDQRESRYQTIVRPALQPEAYRLTFGLPKILEDQILLDENRGIRLAPGVKKRFLSEITVYRRAGERDVIYRLVYTPQRRHDPVPLSDGSADQPI